MINTRRLIFAAAIGVAGLVTPLTAAGSHAAGVCRSDPIVWLSNGYKVQLASSIFASPSAVSAVDYDLHVPAGVAVTKLVYTKGRIGRLEHISVYADSASKTDYLARSTAHASVTAIDKVSMQLVDGAGDWSVTLSALTDTNQTAVVEETQAR
jgi:hypothetical protein